MAELDETRELVRRAYADEVFDAEAGLTEVVRRAGRPPVDDPGIVIERRHTVNVRRRRRLALVGVFVGVVGLVLIIGAATGRLGGGDPAMVGAPPSTAASPGGSGAGFSPEPIPESSRLTGSPAFPGAGPVTGVPSQCVSRWKLDFVGGVFTASDRSPNCPALDSTRAWLMDAKSGNGLITTGAAKVWPVTVTPASMTSPFTFTSPNVPTPVAGHLYTLLYMREGDHPAPGDDAFQWDERAITWSEVWRAPGELAETGGPTPTL
jgi:hypothetical protein